MAAEYRRAARVGRVGRRLGYNSLWCGDHISFPMAILDPFLQLAQAAMVSRRLTFGTSVYLLPLRHPVPVAKQVATLDHLTEGRFIFGVGWVASSQESMRHAAYQSRAGCAARGGDTAFAQAVERTSR